MSTAANHKKRSHRSEAYKRAAFNASSRRAYYRTAREQQNRSEFSRIASLFHRRAMKSNPVREVEP